MTALILGIFAAALLHFCYEAIVAPSLRLSMRYKMFEQRDKLRALQTNCPVDEETFCIVHDRINAGIEIVHYVDLFWLMMNRHAVQSDELKSSIAHRQKIIEQSPPAIKEISCECSRIALNACMANSMGFLVVFVLPMIAVGFCMHWVQSAISSLLSVPIAPKIRYAT